MSTSWRARASRREALRTFGLGSTLLALWGLDGGFFPRAARAATQVGQLAPDFTLPDLNGASTRLADLRGKVILIDFFASWCDPCKKELPELEKLYRELSKRGVVFVGVNIDREKKNAAEMVQRFQLSFKVVVDPVGTVAELYDPPKMPTSYLIDKAGVLRFVNQGFDGAADILRLRQQLESLNR